MRSLIRLVFLHTLIVIAPVHALDAGWYAGFGLGRVEQRFHPSYIFQNGDAPQQFLDVTHGLQADLLVGKRQSMGGRFWLAAQGRLGYNSAEFFLSIPDEPAQLQYSLRHVATLSVIPEVALTDGLSLFGELGAGLGSIQEMKAALATSRYDVDEWQPVIAVGAGLRARVTDDVDGFVQWRKTSYSRLSYDTFDRAGQRIEHVSDEPRSEGYSIGLTKRY